MIFGLYTGWAQLGSEYRKVDHFDNKWVSAGRMISTCISGAGVLKCSGTECGISDELLHRISLGFG